MSTQLAPSAPPVVVDGPGRQIVRREPVPKELEALGVKIAVDPESDMQLLIIPKELRAKANVLAPIQAFQQADPNWRPSLRVVELDPSADGAHFYKQGKNLAPRKQALELLADAAGVVQINAQLLGRERVEVGGVMAETFTHIATLRIRKSDGTLRTLQASRTYEPFAEYEEIRDSVAKVDVWVNNQRSGRKLGDPGEEVAFGAELRKRWLNEIKFAKAKNESKAINRASRSALQIPHTFTAADAAKPFVVVGWNLAPQDSAAVQAAIAQLYGAAPEALDAVAPPLPSTWDEPEEAFGSIVDEYLEDSPAEPTREPAPDAGAQPEAGVSVPPPPANLPEESSETQAPADQEPEAIAPDRAPPAPTPSNTPPTATSTADGGQEPTATPEAQPSAPTPVEPVIPGVEAPAVAEADPEKMAKALGYKIPAGSYQQRTLKWVLDLGEPADAWLAYALRQPWPHDKPFKGALIYALETHRPQMVADWKAEA